MNKEFDCVEMKHKAADKIRAKIANFSIKEELAFWENQTKILREQQKQIIDKEKVKP